MRSKGVLYQGIVILLMLIGLSSTGFAFDDYATLAKLAEMIRVLNLQLKQAKENVKDLSGTYGYGALLNSAADFKRQLWSPDTWKDAIKGLSGGNSARYQELIKVYHHLHPVLTDNEYEAGASRSLLRVFRSAVNTNQAVSTQSEYAYNNLNQHLKTIHRISKKIDQSKNTKAALDLNNRLIVESNYLAAQQLKMQALLNQQLSQVESRRIDSLNRQARMNELVVKDKQGDKDV